MGFFYQILCGLGEGAGWIFCDLSHTTSGKTVKICPRMVFVGDEGGTGFHSFFEFWKEKDQTFA